MSEKIFVLDTNVIMNNAASIYQFGKDNLVVIPLVVLHELDNYKNGLEDKNLQVRIFQNTMEKLSKKNPENLCSVGVALEHEGELLGTIRIDDRPFHEDLIKKLNPQKADHQIISLAYSLQKEGKKVILISQDFNVLVVARSLGIQADQANFEAASLEVLEYSGFVGIQDEDDHAFLYESSELKKKISVFQEKYKLVENEYLIAGKDLFKFQEGFIKKCSYHAVFGIKPKNLEQRALIDALLDPKISIVTATGPAGTGKTLLGLASAFSLIDKGVYDNLLVSRREISTYDDHGFLPGTEQEKIAPYMMPFVDNLKVIRKIPGNFDKTEKINREMNQGKKSEERLSYPFETFSLNYTRGRTLSDSFIIVDEAQNLTPHQARTIITRAGEGTKIFLSGHLGQVDDRYLSTQMNGLAYIIEKMRGSGLYAHVELSEVERSKLAKEAAKLLV